MKEARNWNRWITFRGVAVLTLSSFLGTAAALAQFTPFETTIAKFDAEVAAGVAKDAAGCVSVAVFEGGTLWVAPPPGFASFECHRAPVPHRA